VVPSASAWRRGRDLAHEMQRDGERAGLEGAIVSALGHRTHWCFLCAFQRMAHGRDRFREGQQRLHVEYDLTFVSSV
jgi:hypothetical protein